MSASLALQFRALGPTAGNEQLASNLHNLRTGVELGNTCLSLYSS